MCSNKLIELLEQPTIYITKQKINALALIDMVRSEHLPRPGIRVCNPGSRDPGIPDDFRGNLNPGN